MDRVLSQFDSIQLLDDVRLSKGFDIAFQEDMSRSVPYDAAYFQKYIAYEETDIGRKVRVSRVDATLEAVSEMAKRNDKHKRIFRTGIFDIGIGCGTFLKDMAAHPFRRAGFDINLAGQEWLKENNLFCDPYTWRRGLDQAVCWTLWDVLEHMPEPHKFLEGPIQKGDMLVTSLPIFDNFCQLINSRHYRPDEHYYYFTRRGIVLWMENYGFDCVHIGASETEAGREAIQTFTFYRR